MIKNKGYKICKELRIHDKDIQDTGMQDTEHRIQLK